jgi:phage terminase large subunit
MTPLQIEVPRAFQPLLEPSRYKGAFGGRGSGKSHFFATLLVVRCMAAPTRAVCIREVQRSLEQSVKRLIEDKIAHHKVGGSFRCLNTHIEAPHGGIVIFQGMQTHTAETIKSLEGYDIAWVEEAQALSQRSLDLLRPTIRKPDSELWFSWNPRDATDPVDAMFRGDAPPTHASLAETSWTDNPWFPDVLRDELEWDRRRDPEKFAHIWQGAYTRRSAARVFSNWRVDEFETPADARFYFGGDWGFSIDPSVLVRCWIEGRTLYVDAEVYRIGCEIDHLPFLFGGSDDAELHRLNSAAFEALSPEARAWRGIEGARKWPIIADSARPETISYLKRHGFPKMRAAKKGAGSVEEGVEFLRSYDIVVHPRCTHTVDELSSYSYKIDRLTDEVIPVLEDKRNHVIDSLRYAVESVRTARKTKATWGRG